MKTRNRLLAMLLTLAMVLSMFPMVATAAAGSVTLAKWDLVGTGTTATLPQNATDGELKSGSSFSHYSKTDVAYTGSSESVYTSGWNGADVADKYWLITTSSMGYESLHIAFNAWGTDTSPKNWVLEYSTDGTTWAEVQTYTLANTNNLSHSMDLPAGASNQAILSLRFRAKDTVSINKPEAVAEGGNSRMAKITITGEAGGGTPSPTKLAAPTASPNSSEQADATTVAITTPANATKVCYTTNGDTPDASSTEYSTPIAIDYTGGDTFTIKAIAIGDGTSYTNSDVATFTYTKPGAVTPPEPTEIGTGPVVIEALYVRGSNGAEYSHRWFVLKNISNSPVNISGWSLIRASSTSTDEFKPADDWNYYTVPAGTTLAAGAVYIIRGVGPTTPAVDAVDIDDYDGTSTLAPNAASVKFALVSVMDATPRTGAQMLEYEHLVDYVAYGVSEPFLGTGSANNGVALPTGTTKDGLKRVAYTGDNKTDYTFAALDYSEYVALRSGDDPIDPPITGDVGDVIISQVYGGGGNIGSYYKNDFIELYNTTDAAISLEGWSIQYAPAAGTFLMGVPDGYGNTNYTILPSGTIPAKGYYLIQQSAGAGGTADLPTPDATGLIAMGAANFKVALVNQSTTAITGSSDATVMDFVGAGGANDKLGTAAAPAGSNTTSIIRKGGETPQDTRDNGADFESLTLEASTSRTPRNSVYVPGTPALPALNVTASPATGSSVTSGTKVYLTPANGLTNVAMYYTTNGSAASATSTAYTASGIEVTGATGASVTVNVFMTADGGTTADKSFSFTYTIKAPSLLTDPIPDASFPVGSLTIPQAIGAAVDETVTVTGQLVYRYSQFETPSETYPPNASIIQDIVNGEVVALLLYGINLIEYDIGDVVTVTATRAVNSNVAQLTNAVETSLVTAAAATPTAGPMDPQEFTSIASMIASDTPANGLVLIKGVTLGTRNATGSTTITGTGGTINAYRIIEYPAGVTTSTTVDILAVLSGGTRQLRVGEAYYNSGPTIIPQTADTTAPTITVAETDAAEVGKDFVVAITAADNLYVATVEISYTIGTTTNTVEMRRAMEVGPNDLFDFAIPAEEILAGTTTITFTVTATDWTGNTFTTPVQTVSVIDRPIVTATEPEAGINTGADKKPVFAVEFTNGGAAPTVTMCITASNGTEFIKDEALTATATAGGHRASYTPAADMADGRYNISVTLTKTETTHSVTVNWSVYVGTPVGVQPFYGQLHSHTAQYSDGSGTLADALAYIKNVAKNDNVQFVAFTDHSNYFDASGAANPEAALHDTSLMTAASKTKWETYTGDQRAFNAAGNGITALPGFEMTWSGGPGHMNTFGTAGIISRNNTTLNNKSSDSGMKAYYEELKNNPGSVSQFNHPGSTFGTFSNFSYWDAVIDEFVQLVEVGNGEGAVRSGSYWPSYEYYTMALDKGWHVAPSNNQDNHKGGWGNSNTTRTVIFANDNSEEALLEGIRNRAVYATEDKNIEIEYTLNGKMMGTTIEEPTSEVHIQATIRDTDTNDTISRVQVIVNGGLVAWENTYTSTDVAIDVSLPAEYSYYYLRVTQADLDIAVTAPVWVGDVAKIGILGIESSTIMPVTGEEITFTTGMFNNEASALKIVELTYTMERLGQTTELAKLTNIADIPAGTNSIEYTLNYTPAKIGYHTLIVDVKAMLDTAEYAFQYTYEFEVLDPDSVMNILIDGSNYNQYVNGNYVGQTGNFALLGMQSGMRTVIAMTKQELLDGLASEKTVLAIFGAPDRRKWTATGTNSPYETYDADELAAIVAFAERGGNVIVAGYSNYYENYADNATMALDEHMAAQQNKILAALGSTIRIGDDAAGDTVYNSGDQYRMYLTGAGGSYNLDSPLMAGVDPTQQYSQYAGSTIYFVNGVDADQWNADPSATIPASVTPAVTTSTNGVSDNRETEDVLGAGNTNYQAYPTYDGKRMILASEDLVYGENSAMVIVSGGMFMSDYEVKNSNAEDLVSAYSNENIATNVILAVAPAPVITSIADVRTAEIGDRFTIEGIATSNASGYDTATAFFDCIYIQDGTGGINVFPVSGNIQAGQKLRITGYVSSYQGELQLQARTTSIIDTTVNPVAPTVLSTGASMELANQGLLVKVQGKVTEIIANEGIVGQLLVDDGSGAARVYINGYINSDVDLSNIAVGDTVSVIALASFGENFSSVAEMLPRLRVRDRNEIVKVVVGGGGTPIIVKPGEVETPVTIADMLDMVEGTWYYDAIATAIEKKLMIGISATEFAPEVTLTRDMFVTILYRLAGEPKVTGGEHFADVVAGSWYDNAVSWAVENEITQGTGNGFGVGVPVTRESMVVFLYRYLNRNKQLGSVVPADLSDFPDADKVSDWAAEEMAWAVGAGLLKGTDRGTLNPAGNTMRCEAATLFVRVMEYIDSLK